MVINIDEPRYDQSTFIGRAKYFFYTTNPRNVFYSNKELYAAKEIVDNYRKTGEFSGDVEELWKAKYMVDSAFHPDTGELNFLPGRMSFQLFGNTFVNGGMLTFYRSTPGIVFWQWVNQTFNSIVNYTNRNASAGLTNEQLGQAYVAATTASVVTAIGLNKFVSKRPNLSNGIVGRLVPFVAVAAANCVNIPVMRQRELIEGIQVQTESGEVIGNSKVAAKEAVAQVLPSRIAMAIPGMVIPPMIISKLEQNPNSILRRMPKLNAPLLLALTGVCLIFSTPLCCALFPQKSAISFEKLEPEIKEKLEKKFKTNIPKELYYNKGL